MYNAWMIYPFHVREALSSNRVPGIGDMTTYTRDIPQTRQHDIDDQVRAAAALEEDAEGREDDGEDDFEDVAARWRGRG